jgi:hypothetical protein
VGFVSVCCCAAVADGYLVAALCWVVRGEWLAAVGAVCCAFNGCVAGGAVFLAVAAGCAAASLLFKLGAVCWASAAFGSVLELCGAFGERADPPPDHRFTCRAAP